MTSSKVRRLGLGLGLGLSLGACHEGPTQTTPTATPSASVAVKPEVPAPPKLGERLPRSAAPSRYRLDLELDRDAASFTGRVEIELVTAVPQASLFLHADQIEPTLVTIDGKPASAVRLDKERLLRIDFGALIGAGGHTLAITYKAAWGRNLAGIYKVESGGEKYLFSQFEAVEARQAFPCFDEPEFKTPFDVSVTVPEKDVAIGNTAQIGEEKVAGGKKKVRFASTAKLPTYLVAFAVGPFDLREATIPPSAVRSTPLALRGVAVRGKGDKLAWSLAETQKIVPALERYFGTAYPYDKLDLIAVPDFGAGAMENAGAVTFREQLLLLDKGASEEQRRDIVETAAHELAHQWFGNLVTMRWWDDLWLNEAFASWMGQHITHELYPSWKADLELTAWAFHAMEIDSLVSARKIRQEIASETDIEDSFDTLTYLKGGGLIAMFEKVVGEAAFQKGVQRYLDRHRFGSATTDDFMQDVLAEHDPMVAKSFRQFLDRPGVPNVSIKPVCSGKKLEGLDVSADRFLPLGSSGERAQAFTLPFCALTDRGTSCHTVELAAGATKRVAAPEISACPSYVLPNRGGSSYLRFTPDSAGLQALGAKDLLGKLSSGEKLAVTDAARASFRSGAADLSAVLDVLERLAGDKERQVAFAGADVVAFVGDHLIAPAQQAAFAKRVARAYGPRLKELGWDAKPGEDPAIGLMRRDTLRLLAHTGKDPDVRREALARAKLLLGVGGDGKLKLSAVAPELRELVLLVGVEDGGEPLFRAALAALRASTDANLRGQLIVAIASAKDDKLAAEARALYFDESIRDMERPPLLFGVLSRPEQKAAALAWLKKELDRVLDKLPDFSRGSVADFVPGLCDATLEPTLKELFATPKLASAKRNLDNALEGLRICSAIRARHLPEVEKALAR